MRTLPADIAAQLGRETPLLGYALKIGTNPPVRIHSTVNATLAAESFDKNHIAFGEGILWAGSAEQAVRVALDNNDRALAAIALSQGLRGRDIQLWLTVATNPAPVLGTSAVLVFEGSVAETTIGTDTVEITATTEYAIRAVSPRQRIDKPIFNFVPAPGYGVAWGDGVVQLSEEGFT